MPNQNSWAASAASRRAKATERFWSQTQKLHGDQLDLSGITYTSSGAPITAVCRDHGPFQTKATYLVSGYGCPKCGRRSSAKTRTKTTSDFLGDAKSVHGDTYDYSKVEYTNSKKKVVLICREHGEFTQTPNQHLNGRGCPECANEGKRVRARLVANAAKNEYITKVASALPHIEVDWSTYVYSHKPVRCVCPNHGEFWSNPTNLARGHGCIQCGFESSAERRRLTTEQWVAAAKNVHGDKYDYCSSVYAGPDTRVKVYCNKHQEVFETTNDHIYQATNCPRCSKHLSRAEDAIAAFLAQFTTVVQRDRTIIAPKELDIYLPEHDLAVEYCGMYWHSHGDRDDERKNKGRHAEKFRLCAEKGVRLITLYETEWLERPQAVKRMLRNAIGKSRGRVMARKCEVGRPTPQEARAFYERYHPQGGSGAGEHYGLYWKGKLVSCMRFSFGGNDRGAAASQRQWTLSRYASRVTVAGGAGRLFKAFLKDVDPPTVKSFSDNRWFSGEMYPALGFVLEADVVPDYQVWSMKLGLRPKPHYQRRLIPARLQDHEVDDVFDPETDPRTEAEMTYLMGARRIYDCGKRRWQWTKGS